MLVGSIQTYMHSYTHVKFRVILNIPLRRHNSTIFHISKRKLFEMFLCATVNFRTEIFHIIGCNTGNIFQLPTVHKFEDLYYWRSINNLRIRSCTIFIMTNHIFNHTENIFYLKKKPFYFTILSCLQ